MKLGKIKKFLKNYLWISAIIIIFLIFRIYATIKYFFNGDTAWARRYNGTGNGIDYATAIAVEQSGIVCVTGWSYNNNKNSDFVTIEYYMFGDTYWIKAYNSLGNNDDSATDIAIGRYGNVYVTGASRVSGTSWDFVTIKYR